MGGERRWGEQGGCQARDTFNSQAPTGKRNTEETMPLLHLWLQAGICTYYIIFHLVAPADTAEGAGAAWRRHPRTLHQ